MNYRIKAIVKQKGRQLLQIQCPDDESPSTDMYDEAGNQIDAVIPGCNSFLAALDGGQEEYLK